MTIYAKPLPDASVTAVGVNIVVKCNGQFPQYYENQRSVKIETTHTVLNENGNECVHVHIIWFY